jgi:acetamidase/formamidase
MIHRYQPTRYFNTYGPNPPVLHVNPGDVILTTTADSTKITKEMLQTNPDTAYSTSNPLTGPFYLEGAEPSDTITIEIQRITPTRKTAYSGSGPNFGALTDEVPGRRLLLNEPISRTRYEWELDLENNTATTTLPGSKLRNPIISLHPFIGSIGVAPKYGRVETSLTPGEFGGNMDSPEICQGSTLHLPVSWRGGLLVLGDIHAAQGDGEICGLALEICAEVQIKLGLIKKHIDWPRVVNDEWIMVVGSSRPLIEAYKIAHVELLKWLVTEYGFDKMDALQLVSQVVKCSIANTVDPNYTVVAKFPRKYLPTKN